MPGFEPLTLRSSNYQARDSTIEPTRHWPRVTFYAWCILTLSCIRILQNPFKLWRHSIEFDRIVAIAEALQVLGRDHTHECVLPGFGVDHCTWRINNNLQWRSKCWGLYADNPKISTIYVVRELLGFRFRLAHGLMRESGEGIFQPVLNMNVPWNWYLNMLTC